MIPNEIKQLPNREIRQVRADTIELPLERTLGLETDRTEGMLLETTEMGEGSTDLTDINEKIDDENPGNRTLTIRSNQVEQIENRGATTTKRATTTMQKAD